MEATQTGEDRTITLREIHRDGNSYNLWASVRPDGSLLLEGQDLGDTVASFTDDGEYEYYRTVAAEHVPELVTLLGGKPGDDILHVLQSRWSGERSFEMELLLGRGDVPVERFSW